MNLPQSTLHLPKTWWPAAAIIDPSFPMKLLGEQEKDNFAKLNPAQKARYRATGRGWKVERVGGSASPFRSDTRTNACQFIAISVLLARGGSRSKKKAYRVSNELCKRG